MFVATTNVATWDTAKVELKFGAFEGILDPSCMDLFIDIICHESFRKCRTTDCLVVPSTCLDDIKFSLVTSMTSCMKQQCKQNGKGDDICDSIDAPSVSSFLRQAGVKLNDVFDDWINTGSKDAAIIYAFDFVASAFDQTTNNEKTTTSKENCNEWRTDHDATSDSSEMISTNTSCNPAIKRIKTIDETLSLNSGVLWTCIVFYFTFVVMTMGENYNDLKFRFTIVRIGCFLATVLMSLLVYIGSFHLYSAAMAPSNADIQFAYLVWQAMYLFVSFLCFFGGLMIIAPSDDIDNTISRSKKITSFSKTTKGSDVKCCDFCSCCTVFFMKSVNLVMAGKAQFWDASGEFFWLKLVIMEILEISLQINSLATSATNSQVDEVSLSAWIIAANFIVLPLAIVFVPLICSSSQHSSQYFVMATVMVVEVLFDVSKIS
jgi:hypothetical protein